MSTAREILRIKGRDIFSVPSNITVLDATRIMDEHRIGALVVIDDGRVSGMFTERDVLRRVVAENRPASQVIVGDVMTRQVICIGPDTDMDEVGAIMKERRIRHLPVVDAEGSLMGLLSIGDVNAHHVNKQEQTITFLSDYIYGRV